MSTPLTPSSPTVLNGSTGSVIPVSPLDKDPHYGFSNVSCVNRKSLSFPPSTSDRRDRPRLGGRNVSLGSVPDGTPVNRLSRPLLGPGGLRERIRHTVPRLPPGVRRSCTLGRGRSDDCSDDNPGVVPSDLCAVSPTGPVIMGAVPDDGHPRPTTHLVLKVGSSDV